MECSLTKIKSCLIIVLLLISLSVKAQIMGTHFGDSKENVLKSIANPLGYPNDQDDEYLTFFNTAYKDKTWDYITFRFKLDVNNNSHLYNIRLSKKFTDFEQSENFLLQTKQSMNFNFTEVDNIDDALYTYKAKTARYDIDIRMYGSSTTENKYSVWIDYTTNNIDYVEQNLNGSILNTNFGNSFDKTLNSLRQLLGKPNSYDGESILYQDVFYSGIRWDTLLFLFDNSNATGNLCGIFLSKFFGNLKEAEECEDELVSKYLSAYLFNKNGKNKYGLQRFAADNKEKLIIVDLTPDDEEGYQVGVSFHYKQ